MSITLNSREIKSHLIKQVRIDAQFGGKANKRIITVIDRYGKHEGVFDNMEGIFYRIWNAVKSIFGKSDWQLAVKEMEAFCIRGARESYVAAKEIPDRIMKKIEPIMKKQCGLVIEPTMKILVDATYESNLASTSELNNLMDSKFSEMMIDQLRLSTHYRAKIERALENYHNSLLYNPIKA